jgi:hypothetical protein
LSSNRHRVVSRAGLANGVGIGGTFGATGTLLREAKSEVVLVSRLRAALERLNPVLPNDATPRFATWYV